MMIAGKPDGGMPGPIVGEGALNGEYASIEIGDDEQEGVLGAGHRLLIAHQKTQQAGHS
jgi:hypothetical protein